MGGSAGGHGPGLEPTRFWSRAYWRWRREFLDESRAYNDWQIGLRGDATAPALAEAKRQIGLLLNDEPPSLLPQVDDRVLKTLKFAELLPSPLAVSTLAERISDQTGDAIVALRPIASA